MCRAAFVELTAYLDSLSFSLKKKEEKKTPQVQPAYVLTRLLLVLQGVHSIYLRRLRSIYTEEEDSGGAFPFRVFSPNVCNCVISFFSPLLPMEQNWRSPTATMELLCTPCIVWTGPSDLFAVD